MVNVALAEVPPPGTGFISETAPVAAALRSLARIVAVSCVALTNVVTRWSPFHCTSDAVVKPLPVTVIVESPDPAFTDEGSTEASTGTGFADTVNVMELDV